MILLAQQATVIGIEMRPNPGVTTRALWVNGWLKRFSTGIAKPDFIIIQKIITVMA